MVEVETNVKSFADHFAAWAEHYHGAALASVAHFLAPRFARVYLSATNDYNELWGWGSHPLADPLWSTEQTEIVHTGCEAKRVEKILAISNCDTALRWLRVCWQNRDGAYNCGECEKCLMTMASLRIAGVLDRCKTFESPLDLDKLSQLDPNRDNVRRAEANLQVLEWRGPDPELAVALRQILARKAAADTPEGAELREQLGLRDAEIATLRATVEGYERAARPGS
ncbi:MAG TPA: hypothetical protein VFZ25_14025 [Chloroflexota bacterium]|nr:hypothetical protein [Chloroflexota bacterium]